MDSKHTPQTTSGSTHGQFTISSEYKGNHVIKVPTRLYHKNMLLGALGIKSSRDLVVDLDQSVVTFAPHGKQHESDSSLPFSSIESSEVDAKKRRLTIHAKDSTYKFKFANLNQLNKVATALGGVNLQSGKPMLSLGEEYRKYMESKKDEVDKEDISSDDDHDYKDDAKHRSKSKDKGNKGSEEKDEVKEKESRGIDGNRAEQIRRKQEEDEEYQYLKWKYIDRFEHGAPPLPRHLEKFAQGKTEHAEKHDDAEAKKLTEKHMEYTGTTPKNLDPNRPLPKKDDKKDIQTDNSRVSKQEDVKGEQTGGVTAGGKTDLRAEGKTNLQVESQGQRQGQGQSQSQGQGQSQSQGQTQSQSQGSSKESYQNYDMQSKDRLEADHAKGPEGLINDNFIAGKIDVTTGHPIGTVNVRRPSRGDVSNPDQSANTGDQDRLKQLQEKERELEEREKRLAEKEKAYKDK